MHDLERVVVARAVSHAVADAFRFVSLVSHFSPTSQRAANQDGELGFCTMTSLYQYNAQDQLLHSYLFLSGVSRTVETVGVGSVLTLL